jgi:hypothetical protein
LAAGGIASSEDSGHAGFEVFEQAWEAFDKQHELTRKGIEKFAADYRVRFSPNVGSIWIW